MKLSAAQPLVRRLAAAWRHALLVLGACAALLPGCGGGVGTGGTGSFAAGPITGFGSVIVNDVRFDDVAAQVEDGDGGSRRREDLRLGMTVEIAAGAISTATTGATATATHIRVDSELLGPVGSVDAAGASFTVLGQRVSVDATTVFDERLGGGFASLAAGDLVQVFALFDPATARYRATRVEPADASQVWHLRGPVAGLMPGMQTMQIGSASYGYAGAAGMPAHLAVGQFVRISLSGMGQPAGAFAVTAFGTALQSVPEADGVTLRGLVSSFDSPASFAVNGRLVDAAGAAFLPNGSAGLGTGVHVEVEGTLRNGTLRASTVTLSSDEQERQRGFQLIGEITAVDPVQRTLVVRGQAVSTARPDLRYQNGGAAQLLTGAKVEVKGLLSPDGRRVDATEIKFD